jgi:hypothetical protein
VGKITIEGGDGLKVSGQTALGNTITFDLAGEKPSVAKGDTYVRAKITSTGAECVRNSVSVVIPGKIGPPRPTFDGVISGVNAVLNTSTSPAIDAAIFADPNSQVYLATLYVTYLTVPVVDQLEPGESLGNLYEGADVTEAGGPINQKVTATSTYLDPVGPRSRQGIYCKSDPFVARWPTEPSLPMSAENPPPSFLSVEIDGFVLLGGLDGRDTDPMPPNRLTDEEISQIVAYLRTVQASCQDVKHEDVKVSGLNGYKLTYSAPSRRAVEFMPGPELDPARRGGGPPPSRPDAKGKEKKEDKKADWRDIVEFKLIQIDGVVTIICSAPKGEGARFADVFGKMNDNFTLTFTRRW